MERKLFLSLTLESVAETPQMRFCVRVSTAGKAPRRPLSWEIGSELAGPQDLAMASRRPLVAPGPAMGSCGCSKGWVAGGVLGSPPVTWPGGRRLGVGAAVGPWPFLCFRP